MNIREMIEAGSAKTGNQKALAQYLGLHEKALTEAKGGRRGLPIDACGKLAELIGADRWEVVSASELQTEKDPAKRAYFAPFVRGSAHAVSIALLAIVTICVTAPTETQAAQRFDQTRTVLTTNYAT
ncbi:hypothetical protein HCX48_00005 [Rhodocyclus tenuis]|uniref:Uncharacterized protein n=1 Tax=Rhodocyclus gracilis TaxID=2929842 RepID=A0ABX0WCV4_9RHOO|nr:hypothetical protein [Rhodocyclus gracilis]NJA87611.1 hypothetical protein [Rhodocyclus gracilis]